MLHVDKYSIWQIQINATRQSALSDLEKIRNIFDKYQLEFLKFHKIVGKSLTFKKMVIKRRYLKS